MQIPLSRTAINRARKGNIDAIRTIYDRWHVQVYRYFVYRTGDQTLAEDLTSEVFLKVMNALPDFKARHPNNQEKSLQAWIFQIARNALFDHFRKNNRRKIVDLDEQMAADSISLEHLVEHGLTIERLKSALLKLAEEQRETIILRFILGFSITETAETLRRSEDAIKGLQRRALQNLRVSLTHGE